MKLSIATFVVTLSAQALSTLQLAAAAECQPASIDFSTDCALVVEEVGRVPQPNDGPFSYNMAAMDNFENGYVFFLDQMEGIIYSHQGDSTVRTVHKVFDMSTDTIPAGLTLDWDYLGGKNAIYRVKSMTQGPFGDEVIVVFTSSTLPVGWNVADATLPPAGSVEKYGCTNTTYIGDPYRVGTVPACADIGGGAGTFTAYDVFYRFHLVDNRLVDPVPFLVSETNVSPGHLGGGIATLPNGNILWSTGDCTVYGLDGNYAPQLEFESCGKILRINPLFRGSFRVAAKGVRNSQQLRLFDQPVRRTRKLKYSKDSKSHSHSRKPQFTTQKVLAFMDIGGVTAEEVNAFPLERIQDGKMLNFGWGRSLHDGKAREGTFYVNQGKAFVLSTEPSCAGNAPPGEVGFVQPWIQFGRTATDYYYGISSFAIPSQEESAAGGMLELIWSEFNTGQILGTPTQYQEGAAPSTAFKLKIFDEQGTEFENINFLVERDVGPDSFTYRGDPRLFHFPDGVLGLLMERTGGFYTLTEKML